MLDTPARAPAFTAYSLIALFLLWLAALGLATPLAADPFPPNWGGAAVHYPPVSWPNEPADAADCGASCGEWKPYSRFQNSINDPRVQDPSNGGTAPQNYVNIASSCIDKDLPSIYYSLHQGATPEQDVIMFRWRVEQIANNYATGPSAGSYSASNPWSSALWTVLFDIDGSGFRSLAAHLNGSSGGPATPIDMLAGIWSRSPTQSIDYINDPNVHLLGHNPTAFTDAGSGRILNFQNAVTPVITWPNGAAETNWDYGTSRARLVATRSCNEYFVDYQIPVAMLDATALGGPKITRSTPIAMMFCTANSLNNPFQKDCAINKTWAADATRPAPFGDYISFNKTAPYSQPIVAQVTATAPSTCDRDYVLTAKVQDVLAVVNGEVVPSVKAVNFYYWHDANNSGVADDVGGEWVFAAAATRVAGSMNTWTANWNSTSLPRGRFLIGVQALDDNTKVDDGMTPTGVDNRTFSYLPGDVQSQIYINGAWIAGQDTTFPAHNPALTPSAAENWYGNPDVTGIQTALVGVAINSCGVGPTMTLTSNKSEVAPGGAVIFTLTVSNAGNPGAITVDSLSDVLPAGFTYQGGTTTGDFGTSDPGISGQTLTWSFGSPVNIAGDGSASLSFTATASATSGNYNNNATGTTSFGAVSAAPVAVAVGSARLALSITPDTYSINPGGQVGYTIDYSNPSTVAVSGNTLTVTLPSGTSLVSCNPGCTDGGNTITWSVGALAPGGSGSVTLSVAVDSGYVSYSLETLAELAGTDPGGNPVSALALSTIHVNVPVGSIAAFTLNKTASAVQIAPGGSITYTLSYRNYGGAAGANTVLTDTLPAGMTFSSCTGGCVNASGTVTWNLGSVAASATGSVTVTASAANPFTAANPTVNTASVSWDGGGPVTARAEVGITGQSCSNYYFRDTTTNVGFDGSRRIATVSPVPVAGDSGASVTVTAPVAGAAFLEAVRFYQDPDASVDTAFSGNVDTSLYIDRANGPGLDLRATLYDYDSVSGAKTQLGQQTFAFGGNQKGLLSFSVPLTGTLQKDHRLLWLIEVRSQHNSQTYSVQIQYNGTVTNAISGGTTFANSGAGFCVTPPANLSVTKTVDSPTVPESTTSAIVYTLRYANTGTSTASNAIITDTLPAGVSFTSATLNASPITPTGSNPYSFALGNVAAGASGTLLINASVADTATGLLSNLAGLASDQTSTVSDTASTLVGTPGGGGGGPTAPALSITGSATPSLAGAGDLVTYTLTVVNAGNGTATNVFVDDDFPDQAYYSYTGCTTATGTCGESPSGSLHWDIGTLAAGGVATLTYTMQTATTGLPDGLTLLYSGGSVTDDVYCADAPRPSSCDSDAVIVTVNGNPALALDVSASAASVAPGDVIEYTLTLDNNGSSDATDVVIYNPIPADTAFVEITAGSGSFDPVNNRVVFDVGTLAAGGSTELRFTVRVATPLAPGDTTLTGTATASAGNAANVSDSAVSTASAAPVLSLALAGPGSVPLPATTLAADASAATTISVVSAALLTPGDVVRINGSFATITGIAGNLVTLDTAVTATSGAALQVAALYTLSYQNTGNAEATNIALSEVLPAGWLFVAASPAADGAPSIGSNGTLTWNLGTLAAGASGAVQFLALPTQPGLSTHNATLTGDGGLSEAATLDVLVGGLLIDKVTDTPTSSAGGTADYRITISNALAAPVNGVEVRDVLPAGFTYSSSATPPDSYDGGDTGRPVWIVNVPANGSVEIAFTADIDVTVGPATYQNEVEVTAPAGVGVAAFDPLLSTGDDVTVLLDAGLLTGFVHRYNSGGNIPLVGIEVQFYDAGDTLVYIEHTDANGRFQRVLEAGQWRIEIGSVAANSAQLAGLDSPDEPDTLTIADGEALERDYVYTPATVTDEDTVAYGADRPFTIVSGSTLSRLVITRGGVDTAIDDPQPADYDGLLTCVDTDCTFTAARSGRYVFTFLQPDGGLYVFTFNVHPLVSLATDAQTVTLGDNFTIRVQLNDLPIAASADVPYTLTGESLVIDPDPSDLFTRDPQILTLDVSGSGNMTCDVNGACYVDLAFTAVATGEVVLTLTDGAGLDGAVLGTTVQHTATLILPDATEETVPRGSDTPFTKPTGSGLTRFTLTRGGSDSIIDNPAPEDTEAYLSCTGDDCVFTATRSGRYEMVFINDLGETLVIAFIVHPNASFATSWQYGTAGTPVTVRALLDDLPVEEVAVVPFSVQNEGLAASPDPVDLFTRSPRVLTFDVGPSSNVTCADAGPCYQDLVFTPTQTSSFVRFTLLDTADLDGAVLGDPVVHTVNLIGATLLPISADLALAPGHTVTTNTPVTVEVIGLPDGGNFGFNWSGSDSALGIGALTTQLINFNAPAPGAYRIRVRVTDLNDLNRDPIDLETWLRVIDAGAVGDVCGGDCTDNGSRIPINRTVPVCGLGENDPVSIPYLLQIAEDNPNTVGLCLETVPGYALRLGVVSFLAAPSYGAGISNTDIRSFGNAGQAAANVADPGYTHIGLYYDFEISRLDSAGQAVPVVVPLPRNVQIPVNAVWRKYHPVDGWYTFDSVDGINAVFSAPRVGDVCPGPNADGWSPGLVAGYDCVRLIIVDGGADDLDRQANGVIRDPGVLAVPAANNGGVKIVSGGGGGVTGPWTLMLLLLGALAHRSGVRRAALLGGLLVLSMPVLAETPEDRGWYAGGIAAWAMGESDSDEVTRDLQRHGFDATAKVRNIDRWAGRLFAGYRYNEHLAAEIGYADLGRVVTWVYGIDTVDLDDIRRVPPASGRGIDIAGVGLWPVIDDLDLYARLGIWHWRARYHVVQTGQTRMPNGGFDAVFGLGARYALNDNWQASAGWDRYRIDAEDIDLFGLGVLYSFK